MYFPQDLLFNCDKYDQQVTGHGDNNIGSKARQKVANVSEERTTLYIYTCIVGNQW
jgi:hypothetical protein